MPLLDPDRLFPVEARTQHIARALFESVEPLPIISPHGHCDPTWFATDDRFPDPAALLVTPDHYVLRMLFSHGARLPDLGIAPKDGPAETDARVIWERFAAHYHLFRGTPSQLWLDHTFETLFGLSEPLNASTASVYYDRIETALAQPDYRPRALYERFNIEVLATTDGALDDLSAHAAIRESGWSGRVVPTYRPDAVIDPDKPGFINDIARFGEITGEDVGTYQGYLNAHRARRVYFQSMGATATDHGHPTAQTAALSPSEAAALYQRVLRPERSAADAELFRAQMLTEMARMSIEDGLVMQLHAGSRRNHSRDILEQFGPDKGFDIPGRTDYVEALRPLLNDVGLEPGLTLILFTLDETVYGRELAPLAGVYPSLKLGPPWWFFDSFEGIKRFREAVTETAGFYNTVGFNDDTRAFPSIPARHDVARRTDCAYLAELVATGRLREAEAFELAHDLTYGLAKSAYNL